jgi:arylsulfatase I/J
VILVDDYGWNNVGFHAKDQANAAEIKTPVMDGLATSGIILDRHYAFRYCSPSRSALNSGRNPIHVNTGNDGLTLVNPADPVSGFAGIPRNMTCIGNKLSEAGYYTGQAGKWHLGLATPTHTPKGRGYAHSLTYLDGANDYCEKAGSGARRRARRALTPSRPPPLPPVRHPRDVADGRLLRPRLVC